MSAIALPKPSLGRPVGEACLTMVGPDVETACEVGKPWDPLGLSKLYDRSGDLM